MTPQPFDIYSGVTESPVLLVCDHASSRIPNDLNDLGLTVSQRDSHIAADRGALPLSLALREKLLCTVFASTCSRLVIDMNRPPDHSEAIIEKSEATVIPGNIGISVAERERRIATLFNPYHEALDQKILSICERHAICFLVSIHSFTPVYLGVSRPWEIGILWNKDDRLAKPLLNDLRQSGYSVGDNQPYSGRDPAGYTIRTHAEHKGLPHVLIEVRDDILRDAISFEHISRFLGSHFQNLVKNWAG